jgi:hypothetical protein
MNSTEQPLFKQLLNYGTVFRQSRVLVSLCRNYVVVTETTEQAVNRVYATFDAALASMPREEAVAVGEAVQGVIKLILELRQRNELKRDCIKSLREILSGGSKNTYLLNLTRVQQYCEASTAIDPVTTGSIQTFRSFILWLQSVLKTYNNKFYSSLDAIPVHNVDKFKALLKTREDALTKSDGFVSSSETVKVDDASFGAEVGRWIQQYKIKITQAPQANIDAVKAYMGSNTSVGMSEEVANILANVFEIDVNQLQSSFNSKTAARAAMGIEEETSGDEGMFDMNPALSGPAATRLSPPVQDTFAGPSPAGFTAGVPMTDDETDAEDASMNPVQPNTSTQFGFSRGSKGIGKKSTQQRTLLQPPLDVNPSNVPAYNPVTNAPWTASNRLLSGATVTLPQRAIAPVTGSLTRRSYIPPAVAANAAANAAAITNAAGTGGDVTQNALNLPLLRSPVLGDTVVDPQKVMANMNVLRYEMPQNASQTPVRTADGSTLISIVRPPDAATPGAAAVIPSAAMASSPPEQQQINYNAADAAVARHATVLNIRPPPTAPIVTNTLYSGGSEVEIGIGGSGFGGEDDAFNRADLSNQNSRYGTLYGPNVDGGAERVGRLATSEYWDPQQVGSSDTLTFDHVDNGGGVWYRVSDLLALTANTDFTSDELISIVRSVLGPNAVSTVADVSGAIVPVVRHEAVARLLANAVYTSPTRPVCLNSLKKCMEDSIPHDYIKINTSETEGVPSVDMWIEQARLAININDEKLPANSRSEVELARKDTTLLQYDAGRPVAMFCDFLGLVCNKMLTRYNGATKHMDVLR